MNDSNCPYCSSKVLDKDVTNHNYAQCARCGIPHHFQCYCENDSRCGIYGYDGKTISTIPVPIQILGLIFFQFAQPKFPVDFDADDILFPKSIRFKTKNAFFEKRIALLQKNLAIFRIAGNIFSANFFCILLVVKETRE